VGGVKLIGAGEVGGVTLRGGGSEDDEGSSMEAAKDTFAGTNRAWEVHHTPNPKPKTQNPKPKFPNPKGYVRGDRPGVGGAFDTHLETRNPKPETRNPKPETRNPEPEARSPKPESLSAWIRHGVTELHCYLSE